MLSTLKTKPLPWAKIERGKAEILVSDGTGWKQSGIFSDIEEFGVWRDSNGVIIEKFYKLSFEEVCKAMKWTRI